MNKILSCIIIAVFSTCFYNNALAQLKAGNKIAEAENAEISGKASKVTDRSASGGYLVSLSKTDDGLKFSSLPEANKLDICYASVTVGTISVSVNNQSAIKVNIHSSGALTGSFLNAIVNVAIPKGARLNILLDSTDIAVNIDRITVGVGDLGLPPDIWNLPPLKVAAGPYQADWKELSKLYIVPEWWRDAKFGAWAHWDPQSMPEQGDWYARGMYMQGNSQYNYHLSNF